MKDIATAVQYYKSSADKGNKVAKSRLAYSEMKFKIIYFQS